MGEVADDMVEGACCSWCMQYFVFKHGYPVLCNSCWKEASKEEREGYQQTIEKEM